MYLILLDFNNTTFNNDSKFIQKDLKKNSNNFTDYPTPIVNRKNREPVYDDDVGSSVLKVFNDFRNWTYRMPMIYGSYISLEDNNTTLFLPKNAVNQVYF